MLPKSLKILVVEDHPDTLTVLGMVLELVGHRCTLAPDAGSALARAAHERFDALVTDISLPGRDGWELLRELALREQLPPLVVSMSAGDNFTQRKRSQEAGCHAHLVKPFKHAELEAALASRDRSGLVLCAQVHCAGVADRDGARSAAPSGGSTLCQTLIFL